MFCGCEEGGDVGGGRGGAELREGVFEGLG